MASSYSARGKSRGYVPPEESKSKGSAGRWIGAVAALLLVALGGAWGMGLFGRRTDERIVEIRKISDEMTKQMVNGGPQNEEEAKAFAQSMGQMREKIQALPEDLRGQAFRGAGMGRGFQAAMQANMKAFFATPPAQRDAELDRQIKREQMMQKAFAAAGGFGGGRPGGGGGPGGPGGGGGGGGGGGAGGGPGGGGGAGRGPGGGGPGGPGGGGNPEAWRKQMLDGSSPSQRAQMTEFRNAMDQRRQQLGLGNGGWGGPGGGRGR
jgi:hypothetical protein